MSFTGGFSKVQTSPEPSRPHSPLDSISSSASIPLSYRSGSPMPTPVAYRHNCMSAAAKRYRYLRRLFKFQQMDFQFAAWQMFYLFISPQKVYRNFQYRKRTKAQFARDDPAFIVLLCFWLCLTSIAFSVVLRFEFLKFLGFLIYTIVVETVCVGILVATALWLLTNHFLRKPGCVDEDVEWGYSFDVHLNAYFPSLVILHFFLLFFYPWLKHAHWFVSCLGGNFLWMLAVGYYIYITFLGYSALSILQRTRYILYGLPVLVFSFVVAVLCGWNLSTSLMNFYKDTLL